MKPGGYLSPLQNSSAIFSIYWWFLFESIVTMVVVKWWFFWSHHSLYIYSWHREALSLPSTLPLIHLFISLCIHGFLFCSMGYDPLPSLFIWCSVCPRFAQWYPLQTGFSVLLTCSHHSLSISLLCNITRCTILILYFPCPSPGTSHFSKELCFLLVEFGV